jgi:hypothetical protein
MGDANLTHTFVLTSLSQGNPLPHSPRVKTLKEENKFFYQPLLFIAC